MGELATIHGEIEQQPAHGPGRALGQKRKPQLRLALGYQDEQRGGAPVKTDYFLPVGDDRAVAKFLAVYGDKPSAVDIRLPGSLAGFLDIRHVAFAGGFLRAIGAHNFALRGTLGGPDVLTVFTKEEAGQRSTLRVDELPITGVDDPAAQDLQVFLQMVVSFGLPHVLGYSGLCQVTSRGKESIDTLWQQGVDLYNQYGSWVMVALNPKLLLKPSTMLTPLGTRAEVFVLDLWIPETDEEIQARLERHHELVPAQGAAAAALLYGETAGEEPSAEPALTPSASSGRLDTSPTPTDDVAAHRSLSGESPSSPALPPEPEEPVGGWATGDFTIPDDVEFAPELPAGGAAVFPGGKHKGKRLIDVARTQEGRDYLRWAAPNWSQPSEFVEALRAFVAGLS